MVKGGNLSICLDSKVGHLGVCIPEEDSDTTNHTLPFCKDIFLFFTNSLSLVSGK